MKHGGEVYILLRRILFHWARTGYSAPYSREDGVFWGRGAILGGHTFGWHKNRNWYSSPLLRFFFYTTFYFVSNSCSSSNTIVRSSFESCNNVMLYPETVPFSTISSNMRIAFLIESNESCNICMRWLFWFARASSCNPLPTRDSTEIHNVRAYGRFPTWFES